MFWIFAAVALYLLVTAQGFRNFVIKAGVVLVVGIGAPIVLHFAIGETGTISPWAFAVSFWFAFMLTKIDRIRRVWTDPYFNG